MTKVLRLASKKLWEILIPKYSNSGKKYSIAFHKKWDERVRAISGGLTILKGVKGQWQSPEKKLFVEEMLPVRIYCAKKEIDKILEFTLKYYGQKAVLAYEISSNVLIKTKQNQRS